LSITFFEILQRSIMCILKPLFFWNATEEYCVNVVWVLNGSGGGVVSCNSDNNVVNFFCNSGNGAHFSFSLCNHLPLCCCYLATSLMVHTVFNANGLGANTVLLGCRFVWFIQCSLLMGWVQIQCCWGVGFDGSYSVHC